MDAKSQKSGAVDTNHHQHQQHQQLCHLLALSGLPTKEELFSVNLCGPRNWRDSMQQHKLDLSLLPCSLWNRRLVAHEPGTMLSLPLILEPSVASVAPRVDVSFKKLITFRIFHSGKAQKACC